ncbi:MAG: transporter substrate-binding domain-containing protein [Desulfobacterales bacterium]|nr:transporter substrate-binding domain-containing protein [Desulfobacterales bacterium]MCP4159331.1 transporter substrate-binding domain-containing protein [Deltaproteobacteria bacterium]
MSMNLNFSMLIIMCTIFLSSNIAIAQQTVTIVSAEYEPHNFRDNGKIKGMRIDILTELFKRMGYKYKHVIRPWKRAIDEVRNGKADGIISIWYKPERDEFLWYPKYDYNVELLAIFRHKDTPEIDFNGSPNDIKGLNIGGIQGFSYPKEFLESKIFEFDLVTKDIQNLKKLDMKRVDAIIIDYIVGCHLMKKNKLTDNIVINKKPFNKGYNGYIAFSKKSPIGHELAEQYDIIIQKLVKEGFYQNVFKKWLDQKPNRLPVIGIKK